MSYWDDDRVAMYGNRLKLDAEVIKCKKAICYIHPKLKAKMQHWINAAKGEVGGLGRLKRVDGMGTEATFVVQSVELLEQQASPAQVQLDSMAEMAWMELNHPGWRDNPVKPPILFWHSHVEMAADFSGQDEWAIRSLTAMGGLVISTVGNKRQEFNTRLDFEIPVIGTHITLPAKIKAQPLTWLSAEELDALDAEFAEKVAESTYGGVGKGKKGKELYGIDKEIAALEKAATGTDKVAQAAQAKIEKLRAEKKSYGNYGKVSTAYTPTKHDVTGEEGPPRACITCGEDMDTWEPLSLKVCYQCRKMTIPN